MWVKASVLLTAAPKWALDLGPRTRPELRPRSQFPHSSLSVSICRVGWCSLPRPARGMRVVCGCRASLPMGVTGAGRRWRPRVQHRWTRSAQPRRAHPGSSEGRVFSSLARCRDVSTCTFPCSAPVPSPLCPAELRGA